MSATSSGSAALSLGSLTVTGMTNYRLGYARVSTLEQDPGSQLAALDEAGCQEVFTDHASGLLTERPELTRLLGQLRKGDELVVWRLDRLGRSTSHLFHLIAELGERGVGFRSLTEAIDTTTLPVGCCSGSWPPWQPSSVTSSGSARWPVWPRPVRVAGSVADRRS